MSLSKNIQDDEDGGRVALIAFAFTVIVIIGASVTYAGVLQVDVVNGQWMVQLQDIGSTPEGTHQVWNGTGWVHEDNYTGFNTTAWQKVADEMGEKEVKEHSHKDSTYSITNWSSVITVQDYEIRDKKLYTTFNIEDYRELGGVDCSLDLKYVQFRPDREEYDTMDKKHIPDVDLCVGDQITVKHETTDVYPHPKGRLESKWKYSNGTRQIDNTTFLTEYKEGLFHVTVE